ncbi:MAG: multicopper oxidase domain-containing protein [Pseudomonadota bacterium]
MKRRQFVKSILLGTGAVSFSSSLSGCSGQSIPAATQPLRIPSLIDSREENLDVHINIQHGTHAFFDGVKSTTKGYNGDYLGPTVRFYDGQDTRMRFTNNIGEETTVHGHGLHVPGSVDGGPSNVILPGEVWDVTLPIRQQASTNWYHPHLMGKTAEQVHAGLAGLYLIEDENSLSLPIPKTYGVDDIPLTIQDRTFSNGRMKPYSATMDQIMSGVLESTPTVNGTVNAFVNVPTGWVRLRLLNGSNARIYEFYFQGNLPFFKIATEGGFLESPVPITKMTMAPGERNEIMVDFSDGQTRALMAVFRAPSADNEPLFIRDKKRVLELRPDSSKKGEGTLPDTLHTTSSFKKAWKADRASVTRNFMLNMVMDNTDDKAQQKGNHPNHAAHSEEASAHIAMMHMFGINGKSMSRTRIDERIKKGDIEIWRIEVDEMKHPFHMHGTSFMILQHNGALPNPEDQVWKDVVVVDEGVTDIIMKFDFEATDQHPYMYHCHILEHEDAGMMGQFTVTG